MSSQTTMGSQRNPMRFLEDPRVSWSLGGGALVLFLVILSMLSSSPAPAPVPSKAIPPNPFADPKAGAAHIKQLAEQYGDHFERLSEDDKIFLNSIAMGHGRDLLAKTVRELPARSTKENTSKRNTKP